MSHSSPPSALKTPRVVVSAQTFQALAMGFFHSFFSRLIARLTLWILWTAPLPPFKPVISIFGTTGVGKSKLSIELAESLVSQHLTRTPTNVSNNFKNGAVIISADSMQAYCGGEVMTNKVTNEEQKIVEHRLLGYKQPL